MGRPDRLYTLASSVLDVAVAALEASTAGCPARRYVSDGPAVAWDCEQVTVSVEGTFGHGGDVSAETVEPVRCLWMRGARLGIWVTRCCPTMDDDGNPPPVEDVEASAAAVLEDPQILADAVVAAYKAGELVEVPGLSLEQWQGIGPEGGLTGGVLFLRFDLATVT